MTDSPSDAEPSPTPDPRVRAAAEGDRRAAQELLTELLPRVRNLVRYIVRGDAEVDDIAQQVLLELLRSFRTFRGTSSLRAWSDRITMRVTLAQIRRGRRERKRQVPAGADLQAVRSPDDPPDAYLARRRTVGMLDQLPEEQRQAVVMHHVAGLSVPEVAEELAIPFETARSRLRLGIRKLREQSQRESGEPGGTDDH